MITKNETELALFVLILNYSAAASALKTHRRTEEMPLTIFTTAAASAQCLHFFQHFASQEIAPIRLSDYWFLDHWEFKSLFF